MMQVSAMFKRFNHILYLILASYENSSHIHVGNTVDIHCNIDEKTICIISDYHTVVKSFNFKIKIYLKSEIIELQMVAKPLFNSLRFCYFTISQIGV